MSWLLYLQNKTLPYWVWCSTIVRPRCTGLLATGWPSTSFTYRKTRPRFRSQDTSYSSSKTQYPKVSRSTRVGGKLLIFNDFYRLLQNYDIQIDMFSWFGLVYCKNRINNKCLIFIHTTWINLTFRQSRL